LVAWANFQSKLLRGKKNCTLLHDNWQLDRTAICNGAKAIIHDCVTIDNWIEQSGKRKKDGSS